MTTRMKPAEGTATGLNAAATCCAPSTPKRNRGRFHTPRRFAQRPAGSARHGTGNSGTLRDAWRDAPDRQRLVAVDNVVTQLMAEAQRYYYAPADSTRKHLEASTADLSSATATLPDSLKPAAVRLERHAADLLRAKPPEQEYFDRVRFHRRGAAGRHAARAHCTVNSSRTGGAGTLSRLSRSHILRDHGADRLSHGSLIRANSRRERRGTCGREPPWPQAANRANEA